MRKRAFPGAEILGVDENNAMTYYERIRCLREDRDLTQTQVAALLHVVQRTYSDYEIGRTRIPVESLITLAKFYDVNMDYICGVSDERRPFPKA
jgi:transcriptional regulator with XRE-family HTH domain